MEARRVCEKDCLADGGIPFVALSRNFKLPVSTRYKHVGAWSRADLKCSTDVCIKMATMKGTAAKLRKHILCNSDIELCTRVHVACTHVFPTGGYASGCWVVLNESEAATYHRTICDVYRMVSEVRV